jgi:C_GCAxxG_C_C family probable redox protein
LQARATLEYRGSFCGDELASPDPAFRYPGITSLQLRRNIMMGNVSQRTRELFESGLYCAESVLLAIAESKGIRSDLLPRIATGFCGGVSRTCGMCGAVSGGIMAIGLFAGRNAATESVDLAYAQSRRFMDAFTARFGSMNCKDLTGLDLGTEAGQAQFKEKNIKQQCIGYAEEAAGMALAVIDEKPAD